MVSGSVTCLVSDSSNAEIVSLENHLLYQLQNNFNNTDYKHVIENYNVKNGMAFNETQKLQKKKAVLLVSGNTFDYFSYNIVKFTTQNLGHMEHNFNPNKGDYKYILEEERHKENGEQVPEKKQKQPSRFVRFRRYLFTLFFRRSNKPRKVKAAVPLFIQLLC